MTKILVTYDMFREGLPSWKASMRLLFPKEEISRTKKF